MIQTIYMRGQRDDDFPLPKVISLTEYVRRLHRYCTLRPGAEELKKLRKELESPHIFLMENPDGSDS